MDGEIDFTTYSDRDLREALGTIDGSRFPLNLARLQEEIRRRGASGAPGELPASAEPAVPVPTVRIVNPTTPIELVDLDALPTQDQFTVYWGFLWRSLVMSLATFLVTFVLSMIAAVFLGLIGLVSGFGSDGFSTSQKAVGVIAGIGAGLALTWHFLRWLLQSRMGRFRLLLGREDPGAS